MENIFYKTFFSKQICLQYVRIENKKIFKHMEHHITITPFDQNEEEHTFDIEVDEQSTSTTHRVTMQPDWYEELFADSVPPEVVIEESFEFLLERESKEEILPQFDVNMIVDFFPEYTEEIKKRLSV